MGCPKWRPNKPSVLGRWFRQDLFIYFFWLSTFQVGILFYLLEFYFCFLVCMFQVGIDFFPTHVFSTWDTHGNLHFRQEFYFILFFCWDFTFVFQFVCFRWELISSQPMSFLPWDTHHCFTHGSVALHFWLSIG